MSRYLEIACFNEKSALGAFQAGTLCDRIELCENAEVGGTTPDLEILQTLRTRQMRRHNKTINVMIRPRGGNFVYSTAELATMKNDMRRLSDDADGFVFGILTEDNRVNTARCKDLIALAGGKPCTFHKAFDEAENMEEALDDIESCGFAYILTSGGAKTAVEGLDTLARLLDLVKQKNYKVQIIIGGGVRSKNLRQLRDSLDSAVWFHSSAVIDDSGVTSRGEIHYMKLLLDRPDFPTKSEENWVMTGFKEGDEEASEH